MNDNLFANISTFRDRFEQGLVQLLEWDDLGVFILVLANASFDQHVHNYTEKALLEHFEILKQEYHDAIIAGKTLTAPEDDLLVFLKILLISLDSIQQTNFRKERCWEIQFNHIRSLKPPRISQHHFEGIKIDFDPNGFNFNKPFLQKEKLWEGDLLDKKTAIFYNKFPFVRFHCLLVPEREKNHQQYLTQQMHEYIWAVVAHLDQNLPGIGFAYNSYGASASVNHLHFHMFIKDQALPVMHSDWRHNGGGTDYPLDCHVFDDPKKAWQHIERLHRHQIAYNLLYYQQQMFCIIRKHQSIVRLPQWSSGFGWYEACGEFTTFNQQDFDKINAEHLNKLMTDLKISSQEYRAVFEQS